MMFGYYKEKEGEAKMIAADQVGGDAVAQWLHVRQHVAPEVHNPDAGSLRTFIFSQRGLMAGLGLEGSKISRIR